LAGLSGLLHLLLFQPGWFGALGLSLFRCQPRSLEPREALHIAPCHVSLPGTC
jgi:hypothetical protein